MQEASEDITGTYIIFDVAQQSINLVSTLFVLCQQVVDFAVSFISICRSEIKLNERVWPCWAPALRTTFGSLEHPSKNLGEISKFFPRNWVENFSYLCIQEWWNTCPHAEMHTLSCFSTRPRQIRQEIVILNRRLLKFDFFLSWLLVSITDGNGRYNARKILVNLAHASRY